ncbi:flagellar basal-body rod protein FlgF [Acuticoccus sp. I52.16.1]|uniref:flagellar basal-body rod protein FlgF n=1 Tax=Acuticoccus sp. I52.16.1 TaxID=2928472 RepID=UPI001FCFFEE2|nr:flagellar basal-body rod protein FlgF [Acuticoccus sp. I52.16.1]UOM34333.1 flagellar basal-body rod protein FlgF [Acuticoccus sp. I52.16.1]
MASELYVSLSGQKAMETRLATVANNVANMRTGGFRAETVNFDTVLSDYRADRVNFAAVGEMHIDRSAGPIELTGNPLDVAIFGDGWFGVETPSGVAYTRDGRFSISPEGDLRTLTGYGVMDEGGAPIQLEPAGGEVIIGADGTMTQGGRQVGVLGLFTIAADADLTRYGDTAVLTDVQAEPVVDRLANGVRQGYREGSNVNAIQAISELIEVQRAFDHSTTAVADREETLQRAVRTLGAE